MINFFLYLFASILGISIVLAVIYYLLKTKIKYNNKLKRLIFAYFGVQEYLDLVRESHEKLVNQKSEIQKVLKDAIGKDEAYVSQSLKSAYQELDTIMLEHQKKKDSLDQELNLDEVDDL